MCEFYVESIGQEIDVTNYKILRLIEKMAEVKCYEQAMNVSPIPEEIKSIIAKNMVTNVSYDQGILSLQIDLRKPGIRPMENIFPKELRPHCTYRNGEFIFKDKMNIPRFRVTRAFEDSKNPRSSQEIQNSPDFRKDFYNIYDNNDCLFVECKPIKIVSDIIGETLLTVNDHQQLCGILRLALPSVEIKSFDYGSNQYSQFEYCDEGNTYSITIKNNKFYLFNGCYEEEFETIFDLLGYLNHWDIEEQYFY